MKSFLLFLFLSFCIPISLFAQATVNFETNGNNWQWIVFDGTKEFFDVVANPSVGGINTTDSCAMLQITDVTADPWAGVFCTDFPDFIIDGSNCYVRILVYKDHISDVCLKLEPARTSDYNIPNTVINQWEEILFDYSEYIGDNANTLTIIPDFSANPRTYTSTSYFDQVSFTDVVPVELTSFTAQYVGNTTQLNWTTATELNNLGFDILRSTNGSDFVMIDFVFGKGTTTEIQNYTYVDKTTLSNTNYAYRLKQIDYNGNYHFSEVVNLGESNPVNFELAQNYPNPFNPSTTISIGLPVQSNVTLDIYNIVGERVASLYDGQLAAGNYNYTFNASNLPSGIYVSVLNVVGQDGNSSTLSRKMTLMK
jgi:hypothetical protein